MKTIKTLALFGLIVLAGFQVGRLWFDNFTDRTVLQYFFAFFAPPTLSGEQDIVVPFRIIITDGPGRFLIQYGGAADSEIWEIGASEIHAALRRESVLIYDFYIDTGIIFDYATAIPSSTFAGAFNSNNLREIEYVTSVVFRNKSVYFVENNRALRFDAGLFVRTLPRNNMHFVYSYGEFIPVITGPVIINHISVFNPYLNEIGGITLSFVRSRIEDFFANPVTINNRIGVDGVFTYSSLNTMVRFLPGNIIEYSSFRPIRRGSAPGFSADFSAAIDFINRDSFVINEFFLSGYEARGGRHVFFFDFIVAGLPLNLPDIWPGLYEPIAAIEVVVDHGHVVSYRRIAYQFIVQDSYSVFEELSNGFFLRLEHKQGQAIVLFSCGG